MRATPSTMLANHAYTLDGLQRLLVDQRGTAAFSTAQAKPGSQQFAYDPIGNLPAFDTDTSIAGTFTTANTAANAGTFNMVNQLTQQGFTPPAGTTQVYSVTWDAGGFMLQRGIAGSATDSWKYKHDRWGRLTQVDYASGSSTSAAMRSQYNALGMRCVVDRAPDSWVPPAAPTISQRRLGYFDAGWQLLEEHIDVDLPLATAVSDIDQVEQFVWGLRHIDDLVMRRVNANYAGGADTDFTDAGDRAGDQPLTDIQFSVVATVDPSAVLLERVEYDAYGQAQHHFPEGITGGPGVTSLDETEATDALGKHIYETGYLADADIDRDGTVDATDVAAIHAKVGTAALPVGRISAYGATTGWCGYRFNAGPNICTVRFRHYDPTSGIARWMERDPAGYMDGASLYMYGIMQPLRGSDPIGQDFMENAGRFAEGFVVGAGTAGTLVLVATIIPAAAPLIAVIGIGWGTWTAFQVLTHLGEMQEGDWYELAGNVAGGFAGGVWTKGWTYTSTGMRIVGGANRMLRNVFRGRLLSAPGTGLSPTNTMSVSRWGRPGLQPRDWVMPGPAGLVIYLLSFKWEPRLSERPWANKPAWIGAGETFSDVPAEHVQWPKGGWFWKGLLHQRQYCPPPN